MRAVRCVLRNKPIDGLEGEISQELAKRHEGEQKGQFYMPMGVRMQNLSAETRDFDTTAGAGGIATIKSYAQEAAETRRIEGQSDAYRTANARAITLSSAFSPLIRMFILAGFTATLLIGGRLTLAGDLDEVIDALIAADQAEKLAEQGL